MKEIIEETLFIYLKNEIFEKSGYLKWIFLRKFRFLFFYRIGYVLYRKKNRVLKNLGLIIHEFITKSYGPDIGIRANIGCGLSLGHVKHAFTIREEAIIGKNFHIIQGSTIGIGTSKDNGGKVIIGDNVEIGANSIILGNLKIGNNVTIGAGTFVNRDIPDNSIVTTEKKIIIKIKSNKFRGNMNE